MVKKEEISLFKSKVNKILNSPIFVLIIGFLILCKTIFFYNNTIAISEPVEFDTILGTISFIVVIVSITSILPNRARMWTAIIINFLLSTLLFADNIYYSFSSNVLSVAQLDNLQYGGEIMKTLPSLLEWKQVMYFADIIIILLLILFKEVKITKTFEKGKKFIVIKLLYVFISIFVFLFVSIDYVSEGINTSYNKDVQIRNSTIYGYHISDIINETNIANKAKYKSYNDFKSAYDIFKQNDEYDYGTIKYNFEGMAEQKNIIIVQLESVQEFVINKTINGKEITPNINKFLNENIEFTNMHMQSYSTTADSEYTMMTSTFPMENGMSFAKYFTNTYDDIFKMYNDNGYFTSYMHGNYSYFWNRGNVYGRLKINKTEFKDDFKDQSENINGDLSDELLYIQAVQKLKEYKTPFFAEVVSASSHSPFTLEGLQDRSKVNIDVGKYKDTYFGNYLESMNYADYTFGLFLEKLKQADLYENSVIFIYGDHNGVSMYDEEMIDFLKQLNPDLNDIQIKLNYTRVACGLKLPGVSKIKINKMINKLDIKPAFAYLSKIKDGISLGTNMFASKNYICLNNERIITDKYYFDENWYEIETGTMLDIEKIDDKLKKELKKYETQMHEELDLSISLNINNLLKGR